MYYHRHSAFQEVIQRRFFECVTSGRLYKTRLLLEDDDSDIDINAQNNEGNTALVIASQLDDIKAKTRVHMMRLLLSYGADPNIPDKHGLSVLAWACKYDKRDVVRLLLDKVGIDIDYNLPDFQGDTALLHAVRFGNADLVRTLVHMMKQLDVNIDHRNHYDITPYLEAKRLGFESIASILREEGRACDTIQILPFKFRDTEPGMKKEISHENNYNMKPKPTVASLLRKSLSSEIKQEFIRYSKGWRNMTNRITPDVRKVITTPLAAYHSLHRKDSLSPLRKLSDSNTDKKQLRQTKGNGKRLASKRRNNAVESKNTRKKGAKAQMKQKHKSNDRIIHPVSTLVESEEKLSAENTTNNPTFFEMKSSSDVSENALNETLNVTVSDDSHSSIDISPSLPLEKSTNELNIRTPDKQDLNISACSIDEKQNAMGKPNGELSIDPEDGSEKQAIRIERTSSALTNLVISDDNDKPPEDITKPILNKSSKDNNMGSFPTLSMKKGLLTRRPTSSRLLSQRRSSQVSCLSNKSENGIDLTAVLPAPSTKPRPASAGCNRNYGSRVTFNDVINLCPDLQEQSRRHSFSDIHWLLALKADQQQTAYRLGLSPEELKSKLNELTTAATADSKVDAVSMPPKITTTVEGGTRPSIVRRKTSVFGRLSVMTSSER